MECVTEPNIFAFEIAPITAIASIKNDRLELLKVKMFRVAFKSWHMRPSNNRDRQPQIRIFSKICHKGAYMSQEFMLIIRNSCLLQ